MARVFKFMAGDLVRLKESDGTLTALIENGRKEYREHLTVVFCYWNGYCCCYVLNTGDDNICLICDEDSLELEERAPIPAEEVQPECPKIVREKNLFIVQTRGMGEFYVVAGSFDQAAELVLIGLEEGDYGYYVDREVVSVRFLCRQHFSGGKRFLSCHNGENHLLVWGDGAAKES